jgi:hypothetical protein
VDLDGAKEQELNQRVSRRERRQRQRAAAAAKPIEISFWAVAFLDLLGYRHVLADMDVFPLPPDQAGSQALTQAFARATRLRRRLVDGVQAIMNGQQAADHSREFRVLPAKLKAIAEDWSRVTLFNLPGPDHIVLGCSLARTDRHFPIRGAHALLFGTAATMLVQLWIGGDDTDDTRPIRGGIDVAAGCLLEPENFLCTPALTRAYELESNEAVYPRTLIGGRFLDAMTEAARADGTVEATLIAELAKRIQAMTFVDRDGKIALDFLGEEVRQTLEPAFARELAAGAWRYACAAQEKAHQRGDERVAAKYDWLVEYMRPRLPHWGVQTAKGVAV